MYHNCRIHILTQRISKRKSDNKSTSKYIPTCTYQREEEQWSQEGIFQDGGKNCHRLYHT